MKERSSNFELLRIVAMVLIVAHHYIYYGVEQHHNYESSILTEDLFSAILLPGGVIGVAIFFMLVGYFGVVNNKSNIKKIIIPTFVYIFICYILYMFLDGFHFDAKEIIVHLFPINNEIYWFVTAYLVLTLIKPVLNTLISSKRVLIMIVVFCFIEYFVGRWFLTNIFSFIEAIFYYYIGAYIRLYIKKIKPIISFLMFFSGWLGYIFLTHTNYIPLSSLLGITFIGTISAIGLFLLFKDLNVKNHMLINLLGSVTFDVYLLHEYPLLREYLWSLVPQQYASRYYPLLSILTILMIWLIASLLAILIRKTIIRPVLERL